MEIILDDESAGYLKQLADEEGSEPEALLATLIRQEDECRHLQFQPSRGFVRIRCGKKNCKEREIRKNIYGD